MLQIDWDNWRRFAAPAVDPALWTALVPAAGHGSRLGYDLPKLLYPVADRMILEWLLDFILPNCAHVVFVVSPSGEPPIRTELDRLAPGRYRTVIQHTPTGMGDAVALGLDAVDTPHTMVVWGDQVALRADSVSACLRLHQGPLHPTLTCPTVMRSNPYIHFDRDAEGNINRLRQAREGDPMPEQGESDTGFFCLDSRRLRALLQDLRNDPAQRGSATREFNFLPIIPLAAHQGLTVITPRLMSLEETVGINSKEDTGLVEQFLRRAHAGHQHR